MTDTSVTPPATFPNFDVRTFPGPETIIALRGELDMAAVAIFEISVAEIEFGSLRRVVLDLEQLTFIDVSGLRCVLRLHAACLDHSVALTITRGPRAIQRLFELTRTDGLLPFVPTGR